jgi:hypothetical protein
MRPVSLLSLVLLLGCSRSGDSHTGTAAPPAAASSTPAARPSASAAPAPAAQAIRVTAEQAACAEKWLAGHGLDDYGNPKDTMYAGGAPTFDEKTGKTLDRWALVAKNRPEALQFCRVPLGP